MEIIFPFSFTFYTLHAKNKYNKFTKVPSSVLCLGVGQCSGQAVHILSFLMIAFMIT